jgi:pSer/pThr/pTyr-binding forkhead associated (FHA) protein
VNSEPSESQSPALTEARRRGDPYLVYSDRHGHERVLSLPDSWTRVTIGRGMAADVSLAWDAGVSSVHADLQRMADNWVLVDEGLSRNGSYVNGERITGRRRLLDGDELRFGETTIQFHAPFQVAAPTQVGMPRPELPD